MPLYSLGALIFDVPNFLPTTANPTAAIGTTDPLELEGVERTSGYDFAPKDLLNAPRTREPVGEADETVIFTGRLLPVQFGGITSFNLLDQYRQAGQPLMLKKGDSTQCGYFLIERVRARSSLLDEKGRGRHIEYELTLIKSPVGPNVSAATALQLQLMLPYPDSQTLIGNPTSAPPLVAPAVPAPEPSGG